MVEHSTQIRQLKTAHRGGWGEGVHAHQAQRQGAPIMQTVTSGVGLDHGTLARRLQAFTGHY